MESIDKLLANTNEVDQEFSAWARQCCQFARQQEEAGDYEAARRIMSPFWQEVGARPRLNGLDEVAWTVAATGSLSG